MNPKWTGRGSLFWHRIAEYYMALADEQGAKGNEAASHHCWAVAAQAEAYALVALERNRPDRLRTIGILKRSVEALCQRASGDKGGSAMPL